MSRTPLVAHSLAEVYLYLMAEACDGCGRGPLKGSDAVKREDPACQTLTVAVEVTCGACHARREWLFSLPHGLGVDEQTGLPTVNPTEKPSRLIDVAQWLTLFRVITTQASRSTDKAEARRLGLEAAQCLEEALKFYENDDDLPPDSAFFHPASRERFRNYPQEFSRRRLLDLRAKLPSLKTMQARVADPPPRKRRWWRW